MQENPFGGQAPLRPTGDWEIAYTVHQTT